MDKRQQDYDEEFRDITSHLGDVDRTLPPAGSGPRDWVPAQSPDEPFDPADLPEPHEYYDAPGGALRKRIALGFLVGALVLFVCAILSYVHLIPSPQFGGIAGILGLICVVAGIFFTLPPYHDPENDEAQL